MNVLGTPAVSEHLSEEDEEGDDGGIGVEIITSKTQEELLREIKVLKTKLKIALDGGRGNVRLNVPMDSAELINFRLSRLVSGSARENEPLIPTTRREESSLLNDATAPVVQPKLAMHREVVETEELMDEPIAVMTPVQESDAEIDDPKTAGMTSQSGSLLRTQSESTSDDPQEKFDLEQSTSQCP